LAYKCVGGLKLILPDAQNCATADRDMNRDSTAEVANRRFMISTLHPTQLFVQKIRQSDGSPRNSRLA
jgi:hypothetical protein